MKETWIAIDIGGTKTAAGLISSRGEIFRIEQISTGQEGVEKGLQEISKLIDSLFSDTKDEDFHISGIGIGIPAALEKETDRILWAPNITGWENVDLKGYLENRYQIPAAVEYDGHTAVLGEWWQGQGKGKQSIVDIVIGTGIGSGAIIDGHLLRGTNRLAGAIGWQVLTTSFETARQKGSGLGYWENLAAGPGIAAFAKQALSPEELRSISGSENQPDSKQIFEASQKGYPPAQKVTEQVAAWLGIGIANVISILNPEIIILGGSVGKSCGFLLPDIQRICKKLSQPISGSQVQISISDLGTNAGLLGAAFAIQLRIEKKI